MTGPRECRPGCLNCSDNHRRNTVLIRALALHPDLDTRPNFTQALLPGSGPAPGAAALRLLHVEDEEADHHLIIAHLRRGGVPVAATRVQDATALRAALAEPWDFIISDFHLPGFSGLEALEIVRGAGLDLPFILVSGQIGEDTAVEAMHRGASDYLLKDHLARLAPAVGKALEAWRTRRARRRAEAELRASQAQLSELAQHLQDSIEAERAAIAREIHDDVGGSLTALRFDLAWIERHAQQDAVVQRARQALEVLAHAYEASQRLMRNLRPAILDQGLVAALQWMVEGYRRRTGLNVTLRAADPPAERAAELPAGVPLVAYRTVQEALTNVSKHAQATAVTVDLVVSAGTLSVEVSDNGRGWQDADLAKSGSFGLRGLRERAKLVGGWIDLVSGTQGSTILLTVPLSGSGAADAAAPGDAPDADFEADADADWLAGEAPANPAPLNVPGASA